mmetsp:Transcript_1929/g.2552  ORF Transcript_1929/g.2552 Transcript_1929/m.2552 type:complete len:700 (-) Transcript_1929:70-2169(-)
MPAKGPKKNKLAEEMERMAEEAKKAEAAEIESKRILDEENKTKADVAAAAAEKSTETEQSRLTGQRDGDVRFLELRSQAITKLEAQVKEQEDWERYLECSPLPNPEKENELNTYLSMFRDFEDEEDLLQNPAKYLKSIVDSCCTSEEVIASMQSVEGKAREEGDQAMIEWCTEFYNHLRDTTDLKLDKLTVGYLHVADKYETDQVVTQHYGNPDLKYGCWIHTSAKHKREKVINFENMSFHMDIPVALQKSRTCIRVVQYSYDHFSNQALRNEQKEAAQPDGKKKKTKKKKKTTGLYNVSVGGVVNVQQCRLPFPPKDARRWKMRDITNLTEHIVTDPYPSKVDGQQSSGQAPAYIKYKVPETLFVSGTPQFGWWDEKKQSWETDGVSQIKYDAETRIASFGIVTLRPFAVIQPRALDFPYLSWSVKPNGFNKCFIEVQGSRFNVQIEAVGGKCQLLYPVDPVFASINNTLLDPGVLLTRLAKAGVNLMPTDKDATYCRKPNKNEIELYLNKQVSMVCGLFNVKGSRWNGSRDTEHCMFQVDLADKSKMAISDLPPPDPNAPPPTEPVEESPAAADGEDEDKEEEAEDPDTGIPEFDVTEQTRDAALFVLATKDTVALTQSTDEEVCEDPLEQSRTHVSLRRCLSSYYDRPHIHAAGEAAEGDAAVDMNASLATLDDQVLAMQQTVRRTLALLRVFSFY